MAQKLTAELIRIDSTAPRKVAKLPPRRIRRQKQRAMLKWLKQAA